eukprot:jgi/Chlat1/4822/Chrsp31S04801
MGGGGRFAYPKEIWSPAGGWWADPKYWRRNTAFATIALIAAAVPIFLTSAKLEMRPLQPAHPVPSQLWCKNFGKPE